jgi:hypothetical protein
VLKKRGTEPVVRRLNGGTPSLARK